jgi:putative hydrolase of the HAD superfamily
MGYEKPHPEAFHLGLRGMDASAAWMVGDNPVADVGGAEAVGIRAILVRRTDRSVKRQAESVAAAAELILGDQRIR